MAFATELKKDFKRLADQGGLSHGYLFFGHESAPEKIAFAKELAGYLENKKWRLPEKVLIDAQFINAFEESGIDVVRNASQFLWQKPVLSPRRTLVIDNADNLTPAAQNAILKISEEPPAHALIILLLRNQEILLPALQSRFQKIYVHGKSQIPNPKSETNSKIPNIKTFLNSNLTRRKELIKEIVEGDEGLENFVAGLIAELRKDKIKNYQTLKELLKRWTLINQFNVNKRLQLETALLELR